MKTLLSGEQPTAMAGLQNRLAREQRGVPFATFASNFAYPKENNAFSLTFVLFSPAKSRFSAGQEWYENRDARKKGRRVWCVPCDA